MKKINVARDAEDFSSPYKVALIASHDEQGDVHISLLSSLMNRGDDEMVFGEFITGDSKTYIHERPKTGFLIMNLSMNLWTGSLDFYDKKTEGEEYIALNELPLYRFNTYFGIHTVHYAKLHEISDRKKLNLLGIVANAVRVMIGGLFFKGQEKKIMNAWTRAHTKKLGTLMFLGFTDEEGYPRLVPLVQGKSVSDSRILFTKAPYSKMTLDLKDGQRASIYAMNLDMETVLMKGHYTQYGAGYGALDIDRVYNSMPPVHREIYPERPFEAVTTF